MDWVSHNNSRPAHHSSSRLDSSLEFVPRVINSATASPNIFNSFLHPANKKEVVVDLTPESQSPPPPSITSSPILHDKINNAPAYQENVGGTTYFYPFSAAENEAPVPVVPNNALVVTSNCVTTPEYHVYPGKQPVSSFFLSEDIRNDILNRNAMTLMQTDPAQYPDLPAEVDDYHELYPLEPISSQQLSKPMHPASMYKATHIKTGTHYCLRRLHGCRLQNTKCMGIVDSWKKLTHSNIVQLREVFTTKAFGDNSLVFVYDYHPGSETLLNKHFTSDQVGFGDPFLTDSSTPRPYSYQKNNLLRHQQNNKLPESLIWNYIIQLTSALRVIHTKNLAFRSLDPTKIIITARNRLRLSCLGVLDVVHDPTANYTTSYQQEDLTALGKLVLALACKSTTAVHRDNMATALDMVARSYTADLRNLIMYLLQAQNRRCVGDLMPMIGARFYTQLDTVHNHVEALDHELSKEVQNGRLFRLMAKLATINERPEFNMDPAWAETGDRYMLKLFRDYVFHQVTEDGQPWLDMAHIIQCLNKLDTGVPEKICLMSRDEQSILLVSYSELKHCLDQSFHEIMSSSTSGHNDLSGLEEKM